jgi:thrombospondin type 3 repeat protein
VPGTQEIVEGTASKDLQAFTTTGASAGDPINAQWPKVTTDWTVANPTIGSFGNTLDTDASSHKVVFSETRSGYIDAYSTPAQACSAYTLPTQHGDAWPRFHHDNANSGTYERDAILPGKPTNKSLTGGPGSQTIGVDAPGDDMLCGTATSWQLVTSNSPIDESNFDAATPLTGAPAPAAPGTHQTFAVPAGAQRYLGLRAVDDQGNVGRSVGFDLGPASAGDADNDGVPDGSDNCPNTFNPNQADSDGNGVGDACQAPASGGGGGSTGGGQSGTAPAKSLQLRVKKKHGNNGHRACFKVTVTDESGQPVSGSSISGAGKTKTTNPSGKARVCRHLKGAKGSLATTVTASKPGYQGAARTLRIHRAH